MSSPASGCAPCPPVAAGEVTSQGGNGESARSVDSVTDHHPSHPPISASVAQMDRGATSVALLVSDGLSTPGGIGRVMSYLAEALQLSAPDIAVHDVATRDAQTGLKRHLSVFGAWTRFRRRVRAGSFDIAHVNIATHGSTLRKIAYAATARAAGVKVILHLHGCAYDQWYAGLAAPARTRIAHAFRRADAVVVLGTVWRDFVIDELGVDPSRVHLIPNGVPDWGIGAGRGAWPDQPHILFLGELGTRKGVDVLVPALRILADRGRRFRATLAGNGEVEETRATIEAQGLADRVAVPGWTDRTATRALLADADIFTLPSRAENQPVSILEAMAASLPVVSTRVDAIPDQVVEGQTGYLIAPSDSDALADALDALLADGEAARAMGEAGRARYEQEFEIGVCGSRMATLYRLLARS